MGGRLQGLCCAALDYFWNMFPGISGYPGNIGNIIFLVFLDFYKKDAPRPYEFFAPNGAPRSLIFGPEKYCFHFCAFVFKIIAK